MTLNKPSPFFIFNSHSCFASSSVGDKSNRVVLLWPLVTHLCYYVVTVINVSSDTNNFVSSTVEVQSTTASVAK